MALVAYNNTLNSKLVEEILGDWIDETYHSILEPKEFSKFDYRIDCVMTIHSDYEKSFYYYSFRDVFGFNFDDYTSGEIQSYFDISHQYQSLLSRLDGRFIHDLNSYLDYDDSDNDDNEDALKYENVYSVMHSQFVEATMMLI